MLLVALLLTTSHGFCRTPPRDSPTENEIKLSRAVNDLAFRLFHLPGQPNLVFSPLGVWAALGMTYGITGGERERKILGIDRHGMVLPFSIYRDYLGKLKAEGYDYTLLMVHGIMARKSYRIKKSCHRTIQDYFHTSVVRADLSSVETKDEINRWVKKKTYGRIFEFLKKAEIDHQTEIYYFTASFFKGTWEKEFQQSVRFPHVFHNRGDPTQAKPVSMMYLKSELQYAITTHYQAVKIPYKGDNLDFLVVMPSSMDPSRTSLAPDVFHKVLSSMTRREVEVFLPQFTAELHFPHVLNISRADHRAKLEVDHGGAGPTPLWPAEPSAQRRILVDRPFYFFILDSRNTLILMAGCVAEL